MVDKGSLRERVLRLRAQLPDERHRQWSDAISRRVLALSGYGRSDTVMAYAAFRHEVDPSCIVEAAWAAGKRVVLPCSNPGEKSLELFAVESWEQLAPGTYGIREPAPGRCQRVGADEVDLVCVPGVAFTREGGRLGYGGGYYDRFLSLLRADAVSVGLAFELQLVPDLPPGEHDLRVRLVVTEVAVYPPGDA